MRSAVAQAAVTAGAAMVNDVSGGLADPGMLPAVAALGVPYVAMHWRGHSADMQRRAHYDDVVGEVCTELAQRLEGRAKPRINWLLRQLSDATQLDFHLLARGLARPCRCGAAKCRGFI